MITWSYRETDELWQHEEFETVDECIKDAKENYGMKADMCLKWLLDFMK